jgi:hypothetical protein
MVHFGRNMLSAKASLTYTYTEGAIFGKRAVGKPRLQYLKQVARNTGADSFTAVKKWLAAIPDGKLPTNQKIEG